MGVSHRVNYQRKGKVVFEQTNVNSEILSLMAAGRL
jgi:hypothetical protein